MKARKAYEERKKSQGRRARERRSSIRARKSSLRRMKTTKEAKHNMKADINSRDRNRKEKKQQKGKIH